MHCRNVVAPGGEHVGGIKGDPIEVESLDVVDCMLEEWVSGRSGHKCVVYTNGESRWGYPVDGEEKVHWLETFYVEIKVYAAHFIENKVSYYVGALDLLLIAEVGIKEVWVILRHEGVRPFCLPKLESPFGAGVELCATSVGHDPFLLHFQVAEACLVDDPWNNLWRVLWRDEVI